MEWFAKCPWFRMLKFAFKDVSTKNSEPTYWTILFVMLKIYPVLAKWHVFYIRNRHISVSSFVYKYDQWPHDSYMTGRAGVWDADDIVPFYIALLDFFSATL
jgi:hypothetical protein